MQKEKYNLSLEGVIKKIKKIIPKPYLIFTIRNQEEYIRSWYNQNFHKNKNFSSVNF